MTNSPEACDNQVLVDTAMNAVEPSEWDGNKEMPIVGVTIPKNARFALIDLERRGSEPRRTRGSVRVDDVESLVRLVNEFKSASTKLYANRDSGVVCAVLNDHTPGVPRWGDHQVTLGLKATRPWNAWVRNDNKLMSQADFAEFVEDSVDDFAQPTAAELLELAQTFHATTKVNFRESNYLQSGERQLVYEETVEAKAGSKGQIVIPKTFTLGLAPWEGCDRYSVTARLRFRINNGGLQLGYKLIGIDEVQRQAFNDVLAEITDMTEIQPYSGTRLSIGLDEDVVI